MAQPLYHIHPSQENRLNAQYKDFYNINLINKPKVHTVAIDVIRAAPGGQLPGSGPPVAVGKTEELYVTPESGPASGVKIPLRCFTPPGDAPQGGWPVLVFYHGGGWTLGDETAEIDLVTNMCARAKCVVITVGYRLAPEHRFPAAVDDSWEALLWAAKEGQARLNINIDKLAVGGSSAGGNLAAVVVQRSVARGGPSVKTLLLNIPALDNTRTVETSHCWEDLQHSPALPVEMMMWFRHNYLPNQADWSNPDASPLLWNGDWSKMPPTVMNLGGMDILLDEAREFGEKLSQAGVHAQVNIFEGQPHIFHAMTGVLDDAQRALSIMCDNLHDSFYEPRSVFRAAS